MTVIDLIIQLQQLDQNQTVVLDFSKNSSGMFHLKEVVDAGEITTPDGKNFVMLSPYEYEGEKPSEN